MFEAGTQAVTTSFQAVNQGVHAAGKVFTAADIAADVLIHGAHDLVADRLNSNQINAVKRALKLDEEMEVLKARCADRGIDISAILNP
jgi:hypothetical protein